MNEDELENILEGIGEEETKAHFNPDDHPPIPCNSEFLEDVKKLTKDINNAAKQMTDQEARYLIDLYKILQKIRIHSENQIRAMQGSNEPHTVLTHFFENMSVLEDQTRSALKKYTDVHPIGKWITSIKGLGPILSATLLAHIDIKKCNVAGDLWAYAGYDPNKEWVKDDKRAEQILQEVMGDDKTVTEEHLCKLANKLHIKVESLRTRINAEEIAKQMKANSNGEEYEIKEVKITKPRLLKAIKFRPHNGKLKAACYIMGDSFVKTQNREDDVYGKVFVARLEYETKKNELGDYADQAAVSLKGLRDKTTITYKMNSEGKLSTGHLRARARRYAVKLFLSHLFYVWYKHENKCEPPKPFPIEHMGHAHMIYPPNLHLMESNPPINKKSIIDIVKDCLKYTYDQFRNRTV